MDARLLTGELCRGKCPSVASLGDETMACPVLGSAISLGWVGGTATSEILCGLDGSLSGVVMLVGGGATSGMPSPATGFRIAGGTGADIGEVRTGFTRPGARPGGSMVRMGVSIGCRRPNPWDGASW